MRRRRRSTCAASTAADVTFHDTWYTSGLRGTGSLDFSRRRRRSCRSAARSSRAPSRPTSTSPLAAFPNFTLLAAGVAAVSLGIGRRAIDELVALAEGKRPLFSSKTLAESAVHPDRAGPGRGGAAARRGRSSTTRWPGVGRGAVAGEPGRRRRRGSASASPAPTPRSAAPRSPTSPTRSPAARACTSSNVLQRCLRDAHVADPAPHGGARSCRDRRPLLLGQDVDTSAL